MDVLEKTRLKVMRYRIGPLHREKPSLIYWKSGAGANQSLPRRLGIPKNISQLVEGHASITEEIALKLERALGSTAGFWLHREAQYRELLDRQFL